MLTILIRMEGYIPKAKRSITDISGGAESSTPAKRITNPCTLRENHGGHEAKDCKFRLQSQNYADKPCRNGVDCPNKKAGCPFIHPYMQTCYHKLYCLKKLCKDSHTYKIRSNKSRNQTDTDYQKNIHLHFKTTDQTIVIKGLIDSGAELSLIDIRCLPKDYTIHPTRIEVRTADDSPLETVGMIEANIHVEDILMDTEGNRGRSPTVTRRLVVVRNIEEGIIIGRDCLKKMEALMVFPCGTPINDIGRANTSQSETLLKQDKTSEIFRFHRILSDYGKTIDNSDSSEYEKDLIERFKGNSSLTYPGLANIRPVNIETTGPIPTRFEKTKEPPQAWRAILDQQFNEMEATDVISKISDALASDPVRVHFVQEKDKIRIVGDYVRKNPYLIRQHWSIPSITTILKAIAGKKFFSRIDLKSGFWQVPLTEASKSLTAFKTYRGVYQYNCLPMGIAISSECFQKRMEEVFSHIANVWIFIDDIIIATNNREEHYEALEEVLKCAKLSNLKFNPKKLDILKSECDILGVRVSENRISIDETRIEAIANLPVPHDFKALQRVLGLFSYFREHIPGFGKEAAVLYPIASKGKFQWENIHTEAFQRIKALFVNCKPLVAPDFDKDFTLETDASLSGWGAMLLQQHGVIAFASGTFNQTQIRYKPTKGELLGLKKALQKFQYYLRGRSFTWITDCKPLVPLQNVSGDHTGIMQVWINDILADYTIKEIYRPGSEMLISDCLSRNNLSADTNVINALRSPIMKIYVLTEWARVFALTHSQKLEILQPVTWIKSSLNSSEFRQKQLACPELRSWMMDLSLTEKLGLHVINGVVCKKLFWNNQEMLLPVIPKELRTELISAAHIDDLHPGGRMTALLLKKLCWFPQLENHARNWAKTCITCRRHKITTKKLYNQMISHLKYEKPRDLVCCDYIGPKPKSASNNTGGIIMVDAFSKEAAFYATPGANSAQMIRGFSEGWITDRSTPRQLGTDAGSNFNSREWKEFLTANGMTSIMAAPRHQESNAIAERAWQTIQIMITIIMEKQPSLDWEVALEMAILKYNDRTHSSTGEKPSNLNPDDPNGYVERLTKAQNHLEKRRQALKIEKHYFKENQWV